MLISRVALTAMCAASVAFAADSSLLRLMLPEATTVMGIDVDRARGSSLGQRLIDDIRDDDGSLRRFVAGTGFDPRRDMREIVLSSASGNTDKNSLIAIRGNFNSGKISSYLRGEGADLSQYRGFDVWRNWKTKDGRSNSSFALLNHDTALLGPDDQVRGALDRKSANSNGLSANMRDRVSQVSQRYDAWFVSANGMSGNARAFVPGSVNVDVDTIQQASGGVRFGRELEIGGEVLARSAKDARSLGDVLRFFAAMVNLNSDKGGMEDASRIADSLQVNTSGSTTRFSLMVGEDMVSRMVQKSKKSGRRSSSEPDVI